MYHRNFTVLLYVHFLVGCPEILNNFSRYFFKKKIKVALSPFPRIFFKICSKFNRGILVFFQL